MSEDQDQTPAPTDIVEDAIPDTSAEIETGAGDEDEGPEEPSGASLAIAAMGLTKMSLQELKYGSTNDRTGT